MKYNHIQLSYVIPVYFNQNNANTLIRLLELYSSYSQQTMQRIQFVIVDDASPVKVQIPDNLNLNILIFRITSDIQWNQCGARNLGVFLAKSTKVIVSDSDHHFPEPLFRSILKSKNPRKTVYRFKRNDDQGNKKAKAVNIFYTSKSVFFQSLGYDEEFSGNYGFEDVFFFDMQRRIGNKLRYFTRFKRIIETKIDRDQSYHSLVRDTAVNLNLYQRKKALLKSGDPFIAHSRMFLNFGWELVHTVDFAKKEQGETNKMLI
jgi:hypothetical protein